jgi:hypothetical protein
MRFKILGGVAVEGLMRWVRGSGRGIGERFLVNTVF